MFKELIKTIIVSLMTLSLISVAYAWTEPISTPPLDNVSTPINAGSTFQYKNGNFGLSSSSASTALDIRGPLSGQWTASGINLGATDTGETNYYWHLGYRGSLSTNEYKNLAAWFYNGSSWINPLSLTPDGKVGIGITNPGAAYKLDVAGAINTTGGLYVSGTRKDTVWDGKQDAIAAGTTSQYWRGDKTWQTPTTSQVTEGTNLYFTDARAQAAITGAASTITTANLTADSALVTNPSGKVSVLSTVSRTELGYLDGVSSAIQTQLSTKAPTFNPTFTGNISFPGSGVWKSSGFVGIGTTTPNLGLDGSNASLTVSGTIKAQRGVIGNGVVSCGSIVFASYSVTCTNPHILMPHIGNIRYLPADTAKTQQAVCSALGYDFVNSRTTLASVLAAYEFNLSGSWASLNTTKPISTITCSGSQL